MRKKRRTGYQMFLDRQKRQRDIVKNWQRIAKLFRVCGELADKKVEQIIKES